MSYKLNYHLLVVKEDIPSLPKIGKGRIQKAILEKLTTHPEVFGKPLRRSLRSYRKLRVGDYRVIFRIEENTIKIFAIGHRSTIYKDYEKRL